MAGRQTVIGKHALILVARGNIEIASQIFVYDHIREIRANIEELEVKILMNYDESYFRVFSIKPRSDSENDKKEAEKMLLKFYNDLINASMKLTPQEAENLKKQQIKAVEAQKKANNNKEKTIS